jgi:hypothetical protein
MGFGKSTSTSQQKAESFQAAADNGAVNFGASYIGGNTGSASVSQSHASSLAGQPVARGSTVVHAASSDTQSGSGGISGVNNQQVVATGQYGVGVGAGASVQTGGTTYGAGSTVTIAEPTEAVAALNAALAIGQQAVLSGESVALQAQNAQYGIGVGTGRGTAPIDTSGSGSTPASHTQYFVEFGIILAVVVAGVVYFQRRKSA